MKPEQLIDESSNVPLQIKAEDLKQFGIYLIETTFKNITSQDEFLTVVETMEMLSLKSRVTLWRWKQKNILNPVKIHKGLRYKKNEVLNFLNGGGAEL